MSPSTTAISTKKILIEFNTITKKILKPRRKIRGKP